jgi:DNA-binding transcriptional regulator YbjK
MLRLQWMSATSAVQRPRGAARREALIDAALRIVGEVGPDALTHRRVAEAAGLPLASTTYWFSSKEDLLEAAFELAASHDVLRMRETAAKLAEEPVTVEAIVTLVLTPADDASRSGRPALIATYALWLEAARRPSLRELSNRWTDAYCDAVADILEQAGADNARLAAELVVAAASGLVMDKLARGGTSDLRPPLRMLTTALIGQKP